MLVTSLFLLAVFHLPAHAQALPGNHPGYTQALNDLRNARWMLSHQPGDAKVYQGEDIAIQEIDTAFNEIKKASFDDGKGDIYAHDPVDIHEHGSRLLRAIELLKKAHADINGEEDNPAVQGLRIDALHRIDKALNNAGEAHGEWVRDNQH